MEKVNWDMTIEDFIEVVGFKIKSYRNYNPNGLSFRCYQALVEIGYKNVDVDYSKSKLSYLKEISRKEQLLKYRGIGKKTIKELYNILRRYDLEMIAE